MNGEEIQNKLSMPKPPLYISDANIPEGVELRRGIAAEVEKWGTVGGGVQYEIRNIDRIPNEWFTLRGELK